MILIVDSGSTKCDWLAVDGQGNRLMEKIRTKGLNPAILSKDQLYNVIIQHHDLKVNADHVSHIYFYGAGCGTEGPKALLKEVLSSIFKKAEVNVNEDTLAAVYATINTPEEAAIVCIMGTGSNCSYYDGNTLHQRVNSLGYTLMDEASGNYYGKQLIRDYYFNHMPENIKVAFGSKYNMDTDVVKFNLYKQPNPNAYLASFAEFMFLNKDSEYIVNLIKKGISIFAQNMIMQYRDKLQNIPVHFAGSIAYFSKEEIKDVARDMNFNVGNIIRRPIDGLVSFHTERLKENLI